MHSVDTSHSSNSGLPPLGGFEAFRSPNPTRSSSDTTLVGWGGSGQSTQQSLDASNGPVMCAEEPTSHPQARRPTLAERASRASGDRSFSLGLSLETIQASSRDAEDIPGLSSNSVCKARFRGWYTTEEGRHIPTTCHGALRVLSYNLCAARYLTTDRYPLCPTWAMPNTYRARQIHREVGGCDPDIAAFQEMSIDMFCTQNASASPSSVSRAHSESTPQQLLLGDLLRADGYEGHHAVITDKNGDSCHMGGGSSGKEIRTDFEGVAVFYKTSRFTRLEDVPVPFNLIAKHDRSLRPEERTRVQLASHNVGLVVVLHDKVTSGIVIVGTLHAAWDPVQRPECQQYQIHHLAAKMEEMKSMYDDIGEVSVLMMGDFNAELNSFALNYATLNQLEALPHSGGPVLSPGIGLPPGQAFTSTSYDDGFGPLPTMGGWNGVSAQHGPPLSSPALLSTSSNSSTSDLRNLGALLWPPSVFEEWLVTPPTHSLVLSDAYAGYCKKFPSRVSAVNPSAGGEGKVIDHVLFDRGAFVCVAVGKLDERKDVPTKDVPSDHYPVSATLVPLHAVAFSEEALVHSEGEDDG